MKISKKGFTLMEILIAIAIVGILAAVVMVSMQSYGKKARSSRATAQLSGILPNMVSCWGNGGSISNPDGNGGENVCSIGSGYGQWPGLTGALANYSYESTYLFTNDSNWFFIVRSDGSHDNVTICCNSTMNSCENIGDASAACDQSTTW